MHTEITMPEGPIIFASDLIPGVPWVHVPVSMGYDRFPEKLVMEKTVFLHQVVKHNKRIFYTHDPDIAISRVKYTDTGKFIVEDKCQVVQQLYR